MNSTVATTVAGVLLAAGLCAAGPAGARDAATRPSAAPAKAALEPAFHNTILSTYPDGRTARLWLSQDGGYRAQGRRGDRSSGHWKVKGDKVCLKQSHPLPVPFSFCTPIVAGGVGTTWSSKAVTGESIRVKVTRGRAGEDA